VRLALIGFALATSTGSKAAQSSDEPSPGADGGQPFFTPVVQSVLSAPRWFDGDDGLTHLHYELLLTNGVAVSVTVASLEVLNERGDRIAELSGDRLKAAMSSLADRSVATAELPPSTVGVVWIDLAFADRHTLPDAVEHRLTVTLPPDLPVPSTITYTGARAPLAPRAARVIGPPLPGGRWVAIVGAHRRGLLPVGGGLHNGQRFAIDFSALLDAAGRTHVGDADQNTSYFNYGQPVLAVAAGTVVEAVDRYPDQIPNHNVPVGLEAADGNHVIIAVDEGIFAGYAHLKPGSVRVHRGQRVRRGQILGLLGNSGNTSGPHLHFQLMNRPSLLKADGLPFTLDRFELDGRVPSLEIFLKADQGGTPVPIDRSEAGERQHRGLTGLEVLTFTGRGANPIP
jgi:Peptidase family M23